MRRLHAFAFVLAVACAPAFAQTTQKAAVKTGSGGFAVEILYTKDRPTYIPGNESVWFTRFQRIEGWRQPAGALPVRAVQVNSRVENETTVSLKVSVRQGERYHDVETLVATYRAGENDKIVVEELKQFGIAPITLRVLRAKPLSTALPYIDNRTSALEFLGIEPVDVSFPSYAVRLRNLSGKDIAAVQVYELNERGERSSVMPQLLHNEPLIKVGAVYELNAFCGNSGKLTEEGYAPEALRKVVISTAIFTDGSFDGDQLPAANANALWRGRKAQLERALSLVQNALQSADDPEAVARFRAQVAALKEDVEPSLLAEVAAKFP
ncbi:MAG TPA: hypothetical protein VJT82_09050, partial [Pyrinomonadaceae bacterium]|nr:hypothetical protein [Pyrinomonadaceae bacterium]